MPGRVLFALFLVNLAFPGKATPREIRIAVPVQRELHSELPFSVSRAGRYRSWQISPSLLPVRIKGRAPLQTGGITLPREFDLVLYKGKIFAVFPLEVEEYLKGVLLKEMSPGWHKEALKAQAVVARTYTYKLLERGKGKEPYDLVASESHQVYEYPLEVPEQVARAVAETRGEVLRNQAGKLAEVAYHSCCGGKTATPEEVWGHPDPDLAPVSDPYCSICPNFYWSLTLTPLELGELLGMGPIRSLSVKGWSSSGRVKEISISDGSKELTLTGYELRNRLGTERLRSTLFTVEWRKEGGKTLIQFQGSGSGHGVGLCQWGARAMAEAGKNYREILRFYFPRLHLTRL